jgi:hypothetical protein
MWVLAAAIVAFAHWLGGSPQASASGQAGDLGAVAASPRPSGPVTITSGGTYSGNWTSVTSEPAVRIVTSEPVTIANATVTNRAGGTLIHVTPGTRANVTLSRVTGYGGRGRFLEAEGFGSVVVENCTITQTGGIYLLSPLAGARVTITRNRARNIQSGPGGAPRQFVQFNNVNASAPEVSWNEVINVYGQSEVEDNISLFKTSNVNIHDNFIRGAYPKSHRDRYSGSGILIADRGGSHNRVYNNQVVDTTNVGIGIVAGHDNDVRSNRVVSDGKLNDGTVLAAANAGVVVWNAYDDPQWANNRATANLIGWMDARRHRNDMVFPNAPASDYGLNKRLANPVTRETEFGEYRRWLVKLAANKIRIGAQVPPPA